MVLLAGEAGVLSGLGTGVGGCPPWGFKSMIGLIISHDGEHLNASPIRRRRPVPSWQVV